MLQYIIAGLVLGGIYAISSAGIVVTYVSTGVLNFAFASIAYFIARFYYFLLVQHGWGIAPAAIVSILVAGPALGVIFYLALFRLLRQSSSLVKLVATIGLSVALPAIASLLFSNVVILSAPGLAPIPVPVYEVFGVSITLNQVIAYACIVAVLVIGVCVLKFTQIGLRVRAMVDSEAMTSLSGVNPSRIAVGVWAVSIFLAGLAGVLSAPVIGLTPSTFQLLIAAAFAAVVAARLRRIGVAVAVGLAMGIVNALAQWALPSSSTLAQAIIPSVPFAFIVVFLAYQVVRRGSIDESIQVGGALDRAIRVQSEELPVAAATAGSPPAPRREFAGHALTDRRNIGAIVVVGLMALFPVVLPSFWGGLVGEVMALGVVFLSTTLVTGEGGMLWLCQITFAGMGALTTAQLATNYGWPVLPAIIVGGVLAGLAGSIIGWLTIRLGDLYVALVTLTFAVLMSTLVFTRNIFENNGSGVTIFPPGFASTPNSLSYFGIVVFCILALLVFNLRRSTPGLALSAIRSGSVGSRSLGISVVQMKVIVSALAAFVAGIGGGLLALYAGAAIPNSFDPFVGLVWFAVLVTMGVRSNAAALAAAAVYVFLPALFTNYLPKSLAEVPTALFGLGAVMVARNPDGVLAHHAGQLRALAHQWRRAGHAGHHLPPTRPTPDGEGLATEPIPPSVNGDVVATGALQAEKR